MLLSVEQVTKSYGDRVLLDGVSFYLERGDKVGIIGVNGAGKSTLLRLLAGAEEPDGGTVRLDPGVRMEYLPQNPVFQGERSVLEQVLLGLNDADRSLAEYEARTILNRLGVSRFEQSVGNLSGGERRRVALAAVLARPCDVLILDEPTNHLDNDMVLWLEDYLRAWKGALVMVTHDRYFLERIVGRMAEVEDGRLFTYEGNYDKYLERKAARLESERASERKRQAILRREYQWVMQGPTARGTKSRERLERYEALKAQSGPAEKSTLELNARASRLGKKTIECTGVTKGFGGRTVVRDFDCMLLRDDRIGIVGANGSGKSTLLNLLAGELAPDAGAVETGETVRIGYFRQEVPDMDGDTRVIDYVKEIGSRIETGAGMLTASQLLEQFLFPAEVQWSPIRKLSGGEKRRLFLLSVLAAAPNVLLLDEPTNDLDIQTLSVLEDYLDSFPGAVVAVSHDRYFLDRVVTKIVELDNGTGTVFSGNYTAYSDKKAMLRDARIRAYLNQQQEIRHQEAVIAKLKSFNREKSIRRAESREKMLEKIDRLEKPMDIDDSMDIRLEPDVESGKDVLTVTGLSKSFDSQTLFTDVNFEIKRGERVAIIGSNGTGKTTLLKIINQLLSADAGEIRLGSKVHIGYYDQEHQVLHMDKTLFDEIQDTYPNMNNTQIRNTLASFLFTGDDVFKLIRDLSGGERGRVSLAKLMLSDANFLLLDEPTNHLDITSKEILESALCRYTGTVLYVSHDRYFINRTATRILDLTGQSLINYIGSYDYYLEKKDVVEAAFAARNSRTSTVPGSSQSPDRPSQGSPNDLKLEWKAQKEEQARIRRIQNELRKTEESIHALETRDSEIDALLTLEEVYTDVPRLMELNKEKEEIAGLLEKLYQRWEELAEKA